MKFSKSDSAYILRWSKKIKACNIKGGKCEKCGNTDVVVLSLHHPTDDKNDGFNRLIKGSWSKLEHELSITELLCMNCHREVHYDEYLKTKGKRFRNNKNIYLEFKGEIKCKQCGYDKCNDALVLHHRNAKEKLFSFNRMTLTFNSIEELNDMVVCELNKCDILCNNCHVRMHTNINKFNKFKSEILEKIKIHKPQQKINWDDVIKLRNEGNSFRYIANELKCSLGAVHNIIAKSPEDKVKD